MSMYDARRKANDARLLAVYNSIINNMPNL